ncbi:hypothetical protein G6M89_07560 [Natronolimnobius sp. AArcel1]|uniref:HVO_0234 family beta-propeller protein n=1 Tax=Natronolimnobius sp. AArcel1 TaxID=1679093 RepID=UPI0013EB2F66|nr:hypothetical protein [Natronolimnobius sp. AArcel1]NGM68868.1 hypothetical protein [Natronolimnobius sp. AArcel1]
MDSIEEKRVYGDREGALEAYVASALGVVRVRVAGDTVGEFDLCARCTTRDLAATTDGVVVATDEDVIILEREADTDHTTTETGFGPAVAVGVAGDTLLAAAPDGTVAHRPAVGGDWAPLADQSIATVRAIDGELIGTDSGVYRVHDGGLDHVGLTDVQDVSAAGVPLAATDDGLFKLGNGWMDCVEAPMAVVGADPATESGTLTRAHAVTADGRLLALGTDDKWGEMISPADGPVVALEYGETVYAVTEQGTFCVLAVDDDPNGDRPDQNGLEWRSRSLGVPDVTGFAVVPFSSATDE